MRIDLISLFPEYFTGPLDVSILRRAGEKKLLDLRRIDIRDFSENKHRKVDDRPYGGGPGMVLTPQPTVSAIRSVKSPGSKVIYLSPQGTLLSAAKSRELAQSEHLILLCGHYEGIDERIIELEVDEEISIGDYVLTNGCLAAIVLIDSLVRFIPGVLGDERAAAEDSFEQGLFDHPHYTGPRVFEGKGVPDVLLSGDHARIATWRKARATEKTARRRPELLDT